MQRFGWTALAAALLVLAQGNTSQAQDIVRLGGTVDAKTQTLGFDGNADTELVHRRGYGYGYRGYGGYGYGRPYYGGYRSYYGGFYGGYRPYYGYHRPYYGYYRPYYAGYYQPYYYGSSYYYYPYSSYYYLSPCAADPVTMPQTVVLGSSSYVQPFYFPSQKPVMPPAGNGNGTFPYDGGPSQPPPMPGPGGDPEPASQPKRPLVPLDGKLISIPAKTPAISYPAYGEQPRPLPVAQPPAAPTRFVSLPTSGTTQLTFPAYGER